MEGAGRHEARLSIDNESFKACRYGGLGGGNVIHTVWVRRLEEDVGLQRPSVFRDQALALWPRFLGFAKARRNAALVDGFVVVADSFSEFFLLRRTWRWGHGTSAQRLCRDWTARG